MARKLEAGIRDWIPIIVVTFKECEPFDLLNVIKYTGWVRRVIGNGKEQIEEVKSVLDLLVKDKFLNQKESVEVIYFGEKFVNVEYEALSLFVDLVKSMTQSPTSDNRSNYTETTINNNNYVFNLNIAIDKLVEINPSMFPKIF